MLSKRKDLARNAADVLRPNRLDIGDSLRVVKVKLPKVDIDRSPSLSTINDNIATQMTLRDDNEKIKYLRRTEESNRNSLPDVLFGNTA